MAGRQRNACYTGAMTAGHQVAVPQVPTLSVAGRAAAWLSPDGEIELTDLAEAQRRGDQPVMVCHARNTARRLGRKALRAADVLELYAFVRPARFLLPTAGGLAEALDLSAPESLEDEPLVVHQAVVLLLEEMTRESGNEHLLALAATLSTAGWAWSRTVLQALGGDNETTGRARRGSGLEAWARLPEWQEQAPLPAPGNHPVAPQAARRQLAALLGQGAEERPQQRDYCAAAAAAFAPRQEIDAPHVVLAEAGTGVGKTLGYIAPASLWARKNGAAVWLSTFTKNLQRQIDQELDRLYPDPKDKAQRVVVRKGRENYLCLLNLEEEAGRATLGGGAVALGLMARWAEQSRDGDMVGGDFPSWLSHLLGPEHTLGLTDRRGECLYSACAHYRKCFIERAQRKARRAELVIANHALSMIQAVQAGDTRELPTRYVFDEGHHVFDAADSAFSAHLSGHEAAELRRWIRGSEAGRRRRARGFERRLGDLVAGEAAAETAMSGAIRAAAALPGEGWLGRLGGAAAQGPAETFLARVRDQVEARQPGRDNGYSLEAGTEAPLDGLPQAARQLERALHGLAGPLGTLKRLLAAQLDNQADELDSALRGRIEAACRGLQHRLDTVAAWRAMLQDIGGAPPEDFVDWYQIERSQGRVVDIGLRRHWIDPTQPFAEVVLERCHGALVTSASLRDEAGDSEDWASAEIRTGALHLALPASRVSLPSPFDYATQTRIFVVNDVRRDSPDQIGAAYRELFLAAGGGALGLFTAISRLRQVHQRLAEPLDRAGLALYAQHVDEIDTSTLVDIFRAETDSCLLGTDAVRDGVDVPGRSLRMIVFDRVPWPRPDILHKARRTAFGGNRYDDMLTRLRLKQAFGRLLRRAGDRGVFVMLDSRLPTRLTSAFPESVTVERLGLAEVVARCGEFLAEKDGG